jgi:hypothetical protein
MSNHIPIALESEIFIPTWALWAFCGAAVVGIVLVFVLRMARR